MGKEQLGHVGEEGEVHLGEVHLGDVVGLDLELSHGRLQRAAQTHGSTHHVRVVLQHTHTIIPKSIHLVHILQSLPCILFCIRQAITTNRVTVRSIEGAEHQLSVAEPEREEPRQLRSDGGCRGDRDCSVLSPSWETAAFNGVHSDPLTATLPSLCVCVSKTVFVED